MGAEVDFPSAQSTTGEAAEKAPEGAEETSRQTRQSAAPESYSFQVTLRSCHPFLILSLLCQSIRIGADAAKELQLDAPETETQRARAARQFSLNVQFPSGFEGNSNPGFSTNTNPSQFAQSAPSQFNRQSPSQFAQQDVSQFAQPAVPFQNFPSFSQLTTQPPAATFRQTRYMTMYECILSLHRLLISMQLKTI